MDYILTVPENRRKLMEELIGALPFAKARAFAPESRTDADAPDAGRSHVGGMEPSRGSVFVSHLSSSTKEAVEFKEILLTLNGEQDVFLTSDWSSLESGSLWLEGIFNALQGMDHLVVLITGPEALNNPWLQFEVGAAIGRGLRPKIFVFGGIDLSKHVMLPLSGIQMILTGNTNRWWNDLKELGYDLDKANETRLAKLFRQDSPDFR